MWKKRQEEYKPERIDYSKETMDFIHNGLMHIELAENAQDPYKFKIDGSQC